MRSRFGVEVWLLIAVAAATAGCARQAVVASEPGNPGAVRASVDASLRADLARLAEAQRSYREREGRYADNLAALGFSPTAGVTVSILQGDRNGFSAIANSGDFECAVYSGSIRSPRSYVTSPDAIACRS
ncbi:MAG: hypothetical protein ACE5JR_11395 [Gemmatimonadota bacterium]